MSKSIAQRRAALIKIADAAHTEYPQYKGHWDNWLLGVVTFPTNVKAGLVAPVGADVLVNPRGCTFIDNSRRKRTTVTIYSVANEIDTSVNASSINVLGDVEVQFEAVER